MNLFALWATIKSNIDADCRAATVRAIQSARFRAFAMRFANALNAPAQESAANPCHPEHQSELRRWFECNVTGPGVWKWMHYFDAYEQHLSRYRGTRPVIAEIGVFSGGSLGMWAHYFGEGACIHGIDIDPACRSYERDGIKIHIGDQSDRGFWRGFRSEVPRLDVLIDDGGHLPEQQIVTLEETLGHIAPGGTVIIEDIHGCPNRFSTYCEGLVSLMHDAQWLEGGGSAANPLQRSIESITFLPFMMVIRKRSTPLMVLRSERRGTEWQPAAIKDASGAVVHGRGA